MKQVRCRFSGALLGDVVHVDGELVTYKPTDVTAGETFAFQTIGKCWVDVWERPSIGRMEAYERAHQRAIDSMGAVRWGTA